MKAPPRRREGKPGGGESQEGIGFGQRLTTVERITDPHPEQSPEGEATGRGAGGQPSAASRCQRREGTATDEVERLGVGHKPLEGEPWTWLWGEINPQGRWRSKPSRA